ncbi:MAG: hypothetical protein AB1679_32945 [Actinomycetota bacterium]
MSRTSTHRRAGRATLLATVVLLLTSAVQPGPVRAVDSAAGGLPNGLVVSEDPVGWTPHVLDGWVYAIAQVGDRMVVGGHFSKVRQAGTSEVLTRKNLFSFHATTGVIDRDFAPSPDHMVSAVVAAPGGGAVFVGGRFRHIAGQAKTALAKLDVGSGRLSAGFRATVEWRVDDLVVHGSRLYVAGAIEKVNGVARSGLAAVDVTTGALDPGVNVAFTDPRNSLLIVNRLAIRQDGSKLVALGSFLKAGGQDRPQIAVLDLTGGTARLADWHTDGYAAPCGKYFDTYMRGVDISADGSFMVVVTTGGRARPLCDAVARFELNRTGRNIEPTWVDYSGGDTFTGVALTDAAVYVGGHQRWMNNPYHNGTGLNATPGIGSVPRPGISALDPVNGLPLSWNPGRDRGLGVFAFLATPTGLWIGSDTNNVGGEYHPRLAMFPTAGGKVVRKSTPGRLPAVLYHRTGGRLAALTLSGTGAGPTTPLGGGPDWSQARAAFPADGRLYTAWADGRIDTRPLDGAGNLGPPRFLDLGGLERLAKAKFPVSRLTGMAFDAERGRLYYTIEGDRRLYYRYFTTESGVVGGLPFVASGEGDGLDWSDVRGLAIASGHIYSARTDQQVHRHDFRGGRPVPATAHILD